MKKLIALIIIMAAAMAGSAAEKKSEWTVEKWHAAREADDYREMYFLVQSGKTVRAARAELGDVVLFRRYVELLERHFPKYSPGVVSTALLHMEKLLPAIEPTRALVDLTSINSRITFVADKYPERWQAPLKRITRMLETAVKRQEQPRP